MEGLKGLDDVAYVRFASVYKNFREAKDFEEILGELAEERAEDDLPDRAKTRARASHDAAAARVTGPSPDRDAARTSASCAWRSRWASAISA